MRVRQDVKQELIKQLNVMCTSIKGSRGVPCKVVSVKQTTVIAQISCLAENAQDTLAMCQQILKDFLCSRMECRELPLEPGQAEFLGTPEGREILRKATAKAVWWNLPDALASPAATSSTSTTLLQCRLPNACQVEVRRGPQSFWGPFAPAWQAQRAGLFQPRHGDLIDGARTKALVNSANGHRAALRNLRTLHS